MTKLKVEHFYSNPQTGANIAAAIEEVKRQRDTFIVNHTDEIDEALDENLNIVVGSNNWVAATLTFKYFTK